jgi:AcrR family transcriptional regulator
VSTRAAKPPVGSDRRQALIEAAFALIAERGFEGLRLRDVAAAAGIDHSSLHHHFATKQDLIDAVVGHTVQQFRSNRPKDAPPETLHLHLAGLARLAREQPGLSVVMRELDIRATRDPGVRAIIERHEAGWRVALGKRIEALGIEGRALDDSVELVIATVKGVSLRPATTAAVFARLERLLIEKGQSS